MISDIRYKNFCEFFKNGTPDSPDRGATFALKNNQIIVLKRIFIIYG